LVHGSCEILKGLRDSYIVGMSAFETPKGVGQEGYLSGGPFPQFR
jgi:hypothetical protein